MTAHRRGAQAHLSGQLAGTARPDPQQLDGSTALRIGQSGKRPVDMAQPLGGHTQPVILSPLMRSASSPLTCRIVGSQRRMRRCGIPLMSGIHPEEKPAIRRTSIEAGKLSAVHL
jgi:hypothetical protein